MGKESISRQRHQRNRYLSQQRGQSQGRRQRSLSRIVIMIPEVKIKDQDLFNLMKEAHKEARTIMIDHVLKISITHSTLQDVLDVNIQHVLIIANLCKK